MHCTVLFSIAISSPSAIAVLVFNDNMRTTVEALHHGQYGVIYNLSGGEGGNNCRDNAALITTEVRISTNAAAVVAVLVAATASRIFHESNSSVLYDTQLCSRF